MSEAVIVALITGACAVVAQIILTHSTNAKMLAELEKRSEISDVKLEGQLDRIKSVWDIKVSTLTEAVNKHNAFAERIPTLEEKVRGLQERVADLEKAVTRHV